MLFLDLLLGRLERSERLELVRPDSDIVDLYPHVLLLLEVLMNVLRVLAACQLRHLLGRPDATFALRGRLIVDRRPGLDDIQVRHLSDLLGVWPLWLVDLGRHSEVERRLPHEQVLVVRAHVHHLCVQGKRPDVYVVSCGLTGLFFVFAEPVPPRWSSVSRHVDLV